MRSVAKLVIIDGNTMGCFRKLVKSWLFSLFFGFFVFLWIKNVRSDVTQNGLKAKTSQISPIYDELVQKLCSCLNISSYDKLLYYNTKRDKTKYLSLEDQNGVKIIFYLNEDEVDVIIVYLCL